MENIKNRLISLQNRQKQHKQANREAKRKQWEEIKDKSPEFAELLMGFNEVFGKPESVYFWLDNEKVNLKT